MQRKSKLEEGSGKREETDRLKGGVTIIGAEGLSCDQAPDH